MKKIIMLTTIIAILALVWIPIPVFADDNAPSVTVPLTTTSEKPTILEKDSPKGHRMPQRPVYCTISSTDGISIAGLSEEIVSYEILDSSFENIIASFSEESDFLDFLFSLTGDFQIRFETENYYLSGSISID